MLKLRILLKDMGKPDTLRTGENPVKQWCSRKVIKTVIFAIFATFGSFVTPQPLSRVFSVKTVNFVNSERGHFGCHKTVVFQQNAMLGWSLFPKEAWWTTLSLSAPCGTAVSAVPVLTTGVVGTRVWGKVGTCVWWHPPVVRVRASPIPLF